MRPNGINVPDNPTCLWQEYLDSRVVEYYNDQDDRDARVEQLKGLGRDPMVFFSHINRHGDVATWAVRWQEPRGLDL